MGHAIHLRHHAGTMGVTSLARFPMVLLITPPCAPAGGRISALTVSPLRDDAPAPGMNGLVERGLGGFTPPPASRKVEVSRREKRRTSPHHVQTASRCLTQSRTSGSIRNSASGSHHPMPPRHNRGIASLCRARRCSDAAMRLAQSAGTPSLRHAPIVSALRASSRGDGGGRDVRSLAQRLCWRSASRMATLVVGLRPMHAVLLRD
jgi:hypothetical protein